MDPRKHDIICECLTSQDTRARSVKNKRRQKTEESLDDQIHFTVVGALRCEIAGQEEEQIVAGDLERQTKVIHLA